MAQMMTRIRIADLRDRIATAKRRQIAGTRSQFDAVTLLSETEDLVDTAERAQRAVDAIDVMEHEIERNELVNPRVAIERVKRLLLF